MPPKKRTGNQSAPQSEDPLGEHCSHAEFKVVFTTLAQSIAAKNERTTVVPSKPVANSAAARI